MTIYKKAILPRGFQAAGISAGLKKSGKPDLAVFFSSLTSKVSCQFTTNSILAAPVIVCKKHLKVNNKYQALVVNSGNANCFTGSVGIKDAEMMASLTAKLLGIRATEVLVASTGIIGKRLAIDKIKKAMPVLIERLSKQGFKEAKKAIMTTDTFSKEITLKFNLAGKTINICGIAKGAGMIAPNMATMLCFIFTDAAIAQQSLNQALKLAVNNSFNCISIDGCMSTNDAVMILANGLAGNKLINKGRPFEIFSQALNTVCLKLARLVVEDAEGATKFITIKVDKAKSPQEAKTVALAIANSALFKTAMYGENPNFGRIAAGAGASGVLIEEKKLKIKVSPLDKKNINVYVAVNRGNSSAVVYTSDLTPEYIKINAEYN